MGRCVLRTARAVLCYPRLIKGLIHIKPLKLDVVTFSDETSICILTPYSIAGTAIARSTGYGFGLRTIP
jgi:hypothetical protein